jgi:hypothetical protein
MSKHYLIILIFLSFISVSLTAQTIYTIDKKEIIILTAQDSLFSNMKYLGVAESYSPWENDTNVFSIQMTRMLRRVVKKKGNVVQITKCVNFDISGKFYFAENFDSLKSAIELNANKDSLRITKLFVYFPNNNSSIGNLARYNLIIDGNVRALKHGVKYEIDLPSNVSDTMQIQINEEFRTINVQRGKNNYFQCSVSVPVIGVPTMKGVSVTVVASDDKGYFLNFKRIEDELMGQLEYIGIPAK